MSRVEIAPILMVHVFLNVAQKQSFLKGGTSDTSNVGLKGDPTIRLETC